MWICEISSTRPKVSQSVEVNLLECSSAVDLNEYNGMLTSEDIDLPVLAQLSALAQHAPQSNGSSRFILIDNVYLQIHSIFESKSTCTTFKWLFKVHALLQCVSSNTLLFLK